ncbi:MAG: Sec63 [Chrysothrix sp. TS-e1954]|nr:MAG: Sec63 [Chrysothrix sp. TS-e1954]
MKNTVTYHQDGGIKEYSDLETMQMLGRAGRPQFDRDAIAVILTRQEKVRQYESLIAGQEIIESRLHLNLLDHLNAEVCLGTIHDTASAQKWLSSTFLFVRLTKNHRHYHIQGDEPGKNLDERAEQICRKGLKSLLDCELIEGDDIFRATEVGQAMARYYVQFGSMKLFLGLQRKAKMSEILSAVAQSQELKAVRFRQGDKGLFKEINGSPMTRFPIKVDLAMSAHRVSLIIQATLGGIDLKSEKRFSASMQQYLADQTFIFQHAQRFVRCIVDCQVALGDSISIRNALELERSLAARAWDDTPMQLTQLEGIGLAAVRKLANGGIASVEDLADTDALKIDMIMSRNPPFGANLLNKLKEMPKLRISLRKIGQPLTVHGRGVALNVNAEVGFLNDRTPTAFRKKLLHVSLVAESSDGVLLHFCRLTTQAIGQGSDIGFTARLTNPEQIINCYVSCDEIAGTLKYATLRPKISPALFPSQGPGTASTTGKYVSNSAPKRPLLKAADSHTIDDFDYEDDDIDDTELMNVTHREGFHDIDDYGEDSPISVRQNSAVKQFSSNVLQTAARGEEPRRLPNGKWACHHKCKDKDRCRHLCCNEGLDKAPRTRKNESIAANANVTDYQGFSKLAKPVTSLAAEPSVYIAQANTQKKRAPSKNASLSQEEEPPNKKRTNPIFTSNGKRKRPMLSSSSDPLHLSPFSSPAKGKGLFLSSSTIPHKVSAETVDLSSEGPRSPMQEPAATFGAWDKPRATKRDIDTATKAKVDHDDNDDNSSFHFGEVDQDASPRTRRFESVLPSSPREASGNLYGTDDFDTIDELEVQTAKPTNPSAGNDGSRLAFSNMDVNIQGRMQGAIDQDKLNISQDIDPWILEEFGDIVEFV